MIARILLGIVSVLLVAGVVAPLGAAPVDTEVAAIQRVMDLQQSAWNRGDVDGFMRAYKDAADTTFVGKNVRKGHRVILEDYHKHYATKAQMGQLTFSEFDARLLPGNDGEVRYALVTGRFHLERQTHGETAQDDGIFSLLWEKTAQGWKIIVDHTS